VAKDCTRVHGQEKHERCNYAARSEWANIVTDGYMGPAALPSTSVMRCYFKGVCTILKNA